MHVTEVTFTIDLVKFVSFKAFGIFDNTHIYRYTYVVNSTYFDYYTCGVIY